jgi:Ca-activated chloride channel family protein
MLAVASGQAPTFKAGVDLVSVSVVVKNQKGRLVPGLSRTDFELFDAGRMRDIADLRAEASPVSVAVLLDTSGSMRIGGKWAAARDAVARVASQLQAGRDRIALFAFDNELRVVQPFTTSPSDALRALNSVEPWGSTAMFDAVSATGRRLAEESGTRRAIVVITDGLDNRSRLDAAGVAAAVSAVDVPVYSVVVSAPRDEQLSELSRGTGGVSFVSSTPMDTTAAVGQIVTELRSQYVMTFESGTPAGWHPLLVRIHENTEFVVRTRSGYMAGPRTGGRF